MRCPSGAGHHVIPAASATPVSVNVKNPLNLLIASLEPDHLRVGERLRVHERKKIGGRGWIISRETGCRLGRRLPNVEDGRRIHRTPSRLVNVEFGWSIRDNDH